MSVDLSQKINDAANSSHNPTSDQKDNFSALPDKVALHVLSFLKPKDILNVGKTSSHWHLLSNDENLWKFKLERDFGGTVIDGRYKKAYENLTINLNGKKIEVRKFLKVLSEIGPTQKLLFHDLTAFDAVRLEVEGWWRFISSKMPHLPGLNSSSDAVSRDLFYLFQKVTFLEQFFKEHIELKCELYSSIINAIGGLKTLLNQYAEGTQNYIYVSNSIEILNQLCDVQG